jgi:(2R)-sulfolactate sulfo-lyase subunit alpha
MRPDKSLPPLLLLHPEDNIFVARRSLNADEAVIVDDHVVKIATPIPLGHKVARFALAPGTRIVKYGASIGSATQPIQAGDHVHLHNMKSDYLASHTRDALSREA